MPYSDRPIKPEYQPVVLKVLHYINQNLAGDVSLETLARIANYSPFHFQKIFLEALSETPKQYVIRLRIERSAHFIKIFPHLPINEIACDCGFSSHSIFSRAFKNYYGISAETFRELDSPNMQAILDKKNLFSQNEGAPWIAPIPDIQKKIDNNSISSHPSVSTIYPFTLACLQTTLSHKENISFAFKSLLKLAMPQNLISSSTKFFGIWLDFPFITPFYKCRYLCGIQLSSEIKSVKGINIVPFNKSTYVSYKMTGSMNQTLDALIALNHNHLDPMGYSISEMICFEHFAQNPIENPYESIERNLLIPVKANQ